MTKSASSMASKRLIPGTEYNSLSFSGILELIVTW